APTVCSLHWRSASPDLPTFGLVFKDTSTTEIDTLSLHDALPICDARRGEDRGGRIPLLFRRRLLNLPNRRRVRPGSLIEAGSVAADARSVPLPDGQRHGSEMTSAQAGAAGNPACGGRGPFRVRRGGVVVLERGTRPICRAVPTREAAGGTPRAPDPLSEHGPTSDSTSRSPAHRAVWRRPSPPVTGCTRC